MHLLAKPPPEVGEVGAGRETLEHGLGVEVGVLAVAHQVLWRGGRRREGVGGREGGREG